MNKAITHYEELDAIVKKHEKWLRIGRIEIKGEAERADLSGTIFRYADLHNRDLSYAILKDADLSFSDISYTAFNHADLSGADFSNTTAFATSFLNSSLNNADFSNATLVWATFDNCSVTKTNFREAYITGAAFFNMDFSDAVLVNVVSHCSMRWDNIAGVDDLKARTFPLRCPEVGSFIGWKAVYDYKQGECYIAKLLIPEDAKRSSAYGAKCRASKVECLAIEKLNGEKTRKRSARSITHRNFIYKVGETIEVPNFDEDRWKECSSGIHFFMTRREAVDYGEAVDYVRDFHYVRR